MSEELTRSGGCNSDSVNRRLIHERRANQIRRTQALVSSDYYLFTSHSLQELHQRIHLEPLRHSSKALVQFAGHIKATSVSRKSKTLPWCWNQHLWTKSPSPLGHASSLDVNKTFVVNPFASFTRVFLHLFRSISTVFPGSLTTRSLALFLKQNIKINVVSATMKLTILFFFGSGPETSVYSLFPFYTIQDTYYLTEAMTQGIAQSSTLPLDEGSEHVLQSRLTHLSGYKRSQTSSPRLLQRRFYPSLQRGIGFWKDRNLTPTLTCWLRNSLLLSFPQAQLAHSDSIRSSFWSPFPSPLSIAFLLSISASSPPSLPFPPGFFTASSRLRPHLDLESLTSLLQDVQIVALALKTVDCPVAILLSQGLLWIWRCFLHIYICPAILLKGKQHIWWLELLLKFSLSANLAAPSFFELYHNHRSERSSDLGIILPILYPIILVGLRR
jgi:hypothetical protein